MDLTWAWHGLDMGLTWTWYGLDMGLTWTWHGFDMKNIWKKDGLDMGLTWGWYVGHVNPMCPCMSSPCQPHVFWRFWNMGLTWGWHGVDMGLTCRNFFQGVRFFPWNRFTLHFNDPMSSPCQVHVLLHVDPMSSFELFYFDPMSTPCQVHVFCMSSCMFELFFICQPHVKCMSSAC